MPVTSNKASKAKEKKNESKIGDYMGQPVLIPAVDAHLLRKYFSFMVDHEQLNGVFVIRTFQQLWSIKEQPVVRAYTT